METTVIVVGALGLLSLMLYAIFLIKEEMLERKLYSLLESKLDLEEYLREVNELLEKTKNERKIVKYNLYKTTGLYYKGEKEAAIECLSKIKEKLNNIPEQAEVKKIYIVTLFRIMLNMPYSEQMDKIMEEHRLVLNEMAEMKDYAFNVKMINAVFNLKKGNVEEAKDKFKELKKTNVSRINRLIIRYYLAVAYIELDKVEDAEREIEEIQDMKKKSKKQLFIYKEIDNLIKERRNNVASMSGVDRDLEEGQRKEALDKVNKELEDEMKKLKEEVTNKFKEEARVSATDVDKGNKL